MLTSAKARELQPMADKVIALGREDTEHNRSRAHSILANTLMVRKLLPLMLFVVTGCPSAGQDAGTAAAQTFAPPFSGDSA